MKPILTFLTFVVICVTNIDAAPENRQFSLKTKPIGKAHYKGDTITQTRRLEIEVSRSGKDPSKKITATWKIYGHERKNHKLILIKSGTLTYNLKGGERDTQTTPTVTIKGVRKHKKTTSTGRGKSKRKKTVTVPASGQEYYGYSVKVKLGADTVSEYASKPSLK